MTLRVLVADDEQIARRRLLRLLAAMDDVEVAGECEDGTEVVERVKAGGVDVVLLDVQMPNLTGLDALELLPDAARPAVILCTAYGDHALTAFDKGVVDYIMKPVEAGRLKKALDRVRERAAPRGPSLARLAIPTRNGIVLLDPATVSHAVLEGELITITTSQGDFLCDDTLADLHARLPADRFERVHRKALVNLEHIACLEPTPSGGFLAKMRGGQSVEVSRQAARDLRRRLGLR